jgi:hypothetical protein
VPIKVVVEGCDERFTVWPLQEAMLMHTGIREAVQPVRGPQEVASAEELLPLFEGLAA